MGDSTTSDQGPDSTRTNAADSRVGDVIGSYRLLQRLGEGGMGEVWLAEQEQPVRRKVAVKLVKHGMESRNVIARFEAERQALALMDHSSIAVVFDAGTAPDGRPFFVMEFVNGEPITVYCDRRRLPLEERLELVQQVCEGIQHAHQKGIIHRDLKPSNVLVAQQGDRAVAKIIDFGVAKATAQRLTERTLFTQLGVMVGTPEYMSPEQADPAGTDVDTRTDIYSVGVLLYELLTGQLPFAGDELRAAGFEAMIRKLREQEPPPPSSRLKTAADADTAATNRRTTSAELAKHVSGELDWIVMKALEKDRARRYSSASELAADLRRYRDGEAVLAGPPSAWYRVRKFAQRKRGLVASAALVVGVVLLGLVTTTLMYIRSEANRREAEWRQYVASIRAADLALRVGSLDEARAQLDSCPKRLRGWEWGYLDLRAAKPVAEIDALGGGLNADGDAVITSADGKWKVWSLETGRLRQELSPSGQVGEWWVDSDPSLETMMVLQAGGISLRGIKDSRTIATLRGEQYTYSPDGRFVTDRKQIFDARTGRLVYQSACSCAPTHSSWSPDAGALAVLEKCDAATDLHWIEVSPVSDDRIELSSPLLELSSVPRLSVTTDRPALAVDSRHRRVALGASGLVEIRVVDGGVSKLVSRTAIPARAIRSLEFDRSGDRLAVLDGAGWLRVFAVDSGALVSEQSVGRAWGIIGFSRHGDLIATSGPRNRIWSADGSRAHQVLSSGTPEVFFGCKLNESGTEVAGDTFVSGDEVVIPRVRVVNLLDRSERSRLDSPPSSSRTRTNSPLAWRGNTIARAWDGQVGIWDASTGRLLTRLQFGPGQVAALDLSPDGRQILIGDEHRKLELHDCADGKLIRTAQLEGARDGKFQFMSIRYSREAGAFLVVLDGKLSIWTIDSLERVSTIEAGSAAIEQFAALSSGRGVAALRVGADKFALGLVDLGSHRVIKQIPVSERVGILVPLDHGQRFVSGSADDIPRVWDSARLEPLLELTQGECMIFDLDASDRAGVIAGAVSGIKFDASRFEIWRASDRSH